MNKIYLTLLAVFISGMGVFELFHSWKDYNRPHYKLDTIIPEDTAVAWFNEVMAKDRTRTKRKDSIINALMTRVQQQGITAQDFQMAERLMVQRESLAYEEGLRHDTVIIDTVIYREVHRDTVVYDEIHRDTIIYHERHRDTILYNDKVTGWKRKRKKNR